MTPERFQRLSEVLSRRQPDLTVVTDYVHKGRNLSAIVRNADAAGILAVQAVVGDADYRSFRGTAAGSQNWVRVHRHPSLLEAVTPLKQQGYQIVAAQLGEGSVDFREVDYTKPTALLMGAEKHGVSNEGMALVDCPVVIPMQGMVESFNVSVACGIILSEAQRQRQLAGMYDSCRLSEAQWQDTFFRWAHPKLRQFCEHYGLAFPALDEEGEVIDLPAWYARVREDLQARGIEPSFPR